MNPYTITGPRRVSLRRPPSRKPAPARARYQNPITQPLFIAYALCVAAWIFLLFT